MVIDTSVVVSIVLNEPEARPFAQAMRDSFPVNISAVSVMEVTIVLSKHGDEAERRGEELLRTMDVLICDVDREQLEIAREAYRRFGRGRHPAQLNFGDCFSYALARQLDEPLLFKGDDFSRTDVRIARW